MVHFKISYHLKITKNNINNFSGNYVHLILSYLLNFTQIYLILKITSIFIGYLY